MQTTKDLGEVAATQRTPTNHGANYTSIESIEPALSFIPADDRETWFTQRGRLSNE